MPCPACSCVPCTAAQSPMLQSYAQIFDAAPDLLASLSSQGFRNEYQIYNCRQGQTNANRLPQHRYCAHALAFRADTSPNRFAVETKRCAAFALFLQVGFQYLNQLPHGNWLMLESIDVVLARSSMGTPGPMPVMPNAIARLAQSAERKALNLVVVGSSPTVGVFCRLLRNMCSSNCRTMLFGPCEKMSLGSRSQVEMASDVQVMPHIWDNHLNAVSRDNAPRCVVLHIFPWSYT